MRKINFHPSQVQVIVPVIAPTPAPVVTAEVAIRTPTQVTAVQTRVRNGNGHVSQMVRRITDSERAWLKNKFLQKNGQIEDDDCVTFKSQMVSDTIAIFQITGYISVLHRYVALGRLELRDLSSYVIWMRTKYQDKQGRSIWTQYNNPRFVAIRLTNQQARRTGQEPVATIPIVEVPIQTMAGPVIHAKPIFKAMTKPATYFKT